MMVANIMKNERRWGDLEARKSIVVDYKLGKVTKNNGNRCSAYVPEHHQAIVSPEIARAAHLVASSNKKCGVQDIVVIQQGAFQTIIPTAAAVLSERRQMLRMTQQEVADRANITLRQYQRLESGERNILTSSFGLACRVVEALDMDVSKFYHGDYYLEELKTIEGK